MTGAEVKATAEARNARAVETATLGQDQNAGPTPRLATIVKDHFMFLLHAAKRISQKCHNHQFSAGMYSLMMFRSVLN